MCLFIYKKKKNINIKILNKYIRKICWTHIEQRAHVQWASISYISVKVELLQLFFVKLAMHLYLSNGMQQNAAMQQCNARLRRPTVIPLSIPKLTLWYCFLCSLLCMCAYRVCTPRRIVAGDGKRKGSLYNGRRNGNDNNNSFANFCCCFFFVVGTRQNNLLQRGSFIQRSAGASLNY